MPISLSVSGRYSRLRGLQGNAFWISSRLRSSSERMAVGVFGILVLIAGTSCVALNLRPSCSTLWRRALWHCLWHPVPALARRYSTREPQLRAIAANELVRIRLSIRHTGSCGESNMSSRCLTSLLRLVILRLVLPFQKVSLEFCPSHDALTWPPVPLCYVGVLAAPALDPAMTAIDFDPPERQKGHQLEPA